MRDRAARGAPVLGICGGSQVLLAAIGDGGAAGDGAGRDGAAAAATLGQQIKSGLVPQAEGARKQAAMMAAEALALEDRDRPRALELALKAHKLDPALVPAAAVAARILVSQASTRKAQKIIRETWLRAPHPELAELQLQLFPGDTPEQRLERLRDLLKEDSGGREGANWRARR